MESLASGGPTDIPSCYNSYLDVFCPKKAAQLPPFRPWDCALELLLGVSVPQVYPLSLPEQKVMENYIKEALDQGNICPSTSPATSSFFFVQKKDGGLTSCTDYHALINVTVKYCCPLQEVPASLEMLRGAAVFTKLDLCSAYNLERGMMLNERGVLGVPPPVCTNLY